ncbi:MAG: 2-iminoacetate synthase ThiH [Limisphaerales bacterium]
MSFAAEFDPRPLFELVRCSLATGKRAVEESLIKKTLSLSDFARLISPAAASLLEPLGLRARQLTQQRFGKVIRLFAPLYLSNECINNCRYCGFSRDNSILRVTLAVEEVRREAEALIAQGFRNILLVSGEHPKFVSNGYMAECIDALHELVPGISLEIGPMETADYVPLVESGAEGLVVYQETYDQVAYEEMHVSGPKRNFRWRLDTPERAYAAGFRRLGIGALYGLADWRFEALCLAAHAEYLLRNCWQSCLTLSLPRLRPCAGEFQPLTHMTDREMVQLICAFRLMFPDVGLVLSTRENPKLRDGLIPLGITLMSAGSHTEPGGYTGAGRDKLHHTQHGRIIELGASEWAQPTGRMQATEQFNIADNRSPDHVAQRIRSLGYEPVWKDWDAALS